MTACKHCGIDETALIGEPQDQQRPYERRECRHWNEARYCTSCSSYHWTLGNKPDHNDYGVGREDCAVCAEMNADED